MQMDTKKLKEAQVSSGGVYFRDGAYELTVKTVTYKEGFKGKSVIWEFVVDKASPNPPPADLLKAGESMEFITPNQPGTSASWVLSLEGKGAGSAYSNHKTILTACNGEPIEDEELGDFNNAAVDEKVQALRGVAVRMTTVRKRTSTGGIFTNYKFEPMPSANDEKSIAARRKAIES